MVSDNKNVYVGNRYVPKIFGVWDKLKTYESLSIVTWEGVSYTSKKRVPEGVDILNEEYWVVTGNYNAQVEQYRQDVRDMGDYVDGEVNNLTNYVNSEVDSKANQVDLDETNSQLTQTIEHIGFASQYGFVADYEGVPQYDGLDGNRITATDNTQAFINMLDDCKEKKNLTVYFPRGHYGIVEGNIEKDLTGCTLTIIGDDCETTIIDFIKEDDTKIEYVRPEDANAIATIIGLDDVIIKDIQFKATTNYNNIGGNNKHHESAYYGSVWGLIIKDTKRVKLERLKTTRFNYRGIATAVSNINNPIEKVELIDCIGMYNKGAGFWVEYVDTFIVDGGEFAYNGQLGVRGTGYAVTANKGVKKCIVKGGAYFHHNHRSAFDTHECINVFMENVIFDSNACRHFNAEDYRATGKDNSITLRNVSMSQSDKAFLRKCYMALIDNPSPSVNGANHINISIQDHNNTVKNITFDNVVIDGAYNGADILNNLTTYSIIIQAGYSTLSINNSKIDLKEWEVHNDRSYSSMPISLAVKKIEIYNSFIRWLEDSSWGGVERDKGSLFEIQPSFSGKELRIKNTSFELNNSYFIARRGSGGTSIEHVGVDNTSVREFENISINWLDIPSDSNDGRYFGSVNKDYNMKMNNVYVSDRIKSFLVPSSLSLSSTKAKWLKFPTPKEEGEGLLEIIVDGEITNNYVLEVKHRGSYLKVVNDIVKEEEPKIDFGNREVFVDSNGITKTRFIINAKTTVGAPHDFVEVNIFGETYSWGIESINEL